MPYLSHRIKRLEDLQPKEQKPLKTFIIVEADGKPLNDHYADVKREADTLEAWGKFEITVVSEECKAITEQIMAGEGT